MDVKDFIRYFYKKIWIVLISLVLCSALSGFFTYFGSVSYVSDPKIIVGPQSIVSKDGRFVTNLAYVISDLIDNDMVVSRLSQETGLKIDKDSIKSIVSTEINDQHQRVSITVRSTDMETVRLIADKLPDIITSTAKELFNVDNLMVIKSGKIAAEGKDYKKNIISGAVAGVGLGFFLIFLLLTYDDVIRGRRDIKRLFGVEYLGSVNNQDKNEKSEVDNISLLCTKLIIKSNNMSLKAIVNIGMGLENNNEYMLGLAESLASVGKKVLVVELNKLSQTVVPKINCQVKSGIGDLLQDNSVSIDEIVYSTNVANLDITPFGTSDDMSLASLVGEKLPEFVKYAKERYDLILFNLPLQLGMERALMVANACDSSMLSIKYGSVKVREVETVLESLKDSNIGLTGYCSVI